MTKQPRYLEMWFREVANEIKEKGVIRVIPISFLVSMAVPIIGIMIWADDTFFEAVTSNTSNAEIIMVILAGILTFNSITLALSWTALSKILEVISSPKFSSYLRSKQLFETYVFYVKHIHYIQLMAALITLVGLVSVVFIGLPLIAAKMIFGVSVGYTVFAIYWAHGAVNIVTDLLWHHSTFEAE